MKRLLFVLSWFTLTAFAEEAKKTRDEQVLEDREALSKNEAWIYNDLSKAFAEAKRTKRPLMVVHRCIP